MTVRHRALFHLTETGKTGAVLQAVRNLRLDMGDEVEIEVVAHGDGVKAFLLTGQHVDDIRRMTEEGVRFAVCANSIRAMSFSRDDFQRSVEVVPSGIGEIVRRQSEGYAYLRL
ncbi:DsrE family protein [uncultured Methanofollis sp.]|uniref:DsrE family protein n=1 Tax=uncultured Methanofollis sp. TaxID=262500 RepID=UPI002607A411|nr:DsrE family protein [uncultured Methanofollis sp.]